MGNKEKYMYSPGWLKITYKGGHAVKENLTKPKVKIKTVKNLCFGQNTNSGGWDAYFVFEGATLKKILTIE